MNINSITANLKGTHKTAARELLKKAKQNKKLSLTDFKLFAPDYTSVSQAQVSNVLSCTRQTINRYVKEGMPKNEDNTYNLTDVINWLLKKEEEKHIYKGDDPRTSEEIQKLKYQNQKLELEIMEKQKKSIPRDEVIQNQKKQITELLNYWRNGYRANSREMADKLGVKDIDKFHGVIDKFIKEGVNKFSKYGYEV